MHLLIYMLISIIPFLNDWSKIGYTITQYIMVIYEPKAPFDMRLTESSQTFLADSVSKMCLIIQFWTSDSVRNV